MPPWDLRSTFPSELLSEIFLHLISSPSPSSSSPSPNPTNSITRPLLVSHICTHWRAAALNTPRLWARLFLQLGLSKAKAQADLVQTWMERSGGCPLTIYVFWEDPPFARSHPALECLIQHSSRWKEMFFYLPFDVFRRFGQVLGKVPLLTDLSIGIGTETADISLNEDDEGEDNEDNDNDSDPDDADDDSTVESRSKAGRGYQLEVFKYSPKLTSLECINISPFLFTFPWRNLTNIPVVAVTIEECLSILRQSSSLQKAGFVFLSTSSSPASTIATNNTNTIPARGLGPIDHASLTHLSILTSPWDEQIDLTPLFPLLTLSNLLSLTICNLKSHFGTAGFTSFLSRLGSLQMLHLRKTALSDQNLVAGLRLVPTVERLVVHPLKEGHGPPSVTEVVFDELRWKNWIVDGEYTEFEGYNKNDEGGSEAEESDRGADPGRARRQRSSSELPLLPKLTSIEVKLDNTIADAFIHMVQSRRTSIHLSKPYGYRKPKSRSNAENGKPSGLVVVAEGEEEEREEEEEEEDMAKPSILEHVRIRYSEPLHAQFMSAFEDFQKDGLKLELDYMTENGGVEFGIN